MIPSTNMSPDEVEAVVCFVVVCICTGANTVVRGLNYRQQRKDEDVWGGTLLATHPRKTFIAMVIVLALGLVAGAAMIYLHSPEALQRGSDYMERCYRSRCPYQLSESRY